MPALFKILAGDSGQISLRAIASLGEQYVDEMRSRLPAGRVAERIVDKMLRNAWNLGHISFILPKASKHSGQDKSMEAEESQAAKLP